MLDIHAKALFLATRTETLGQRASETRRSQSAQRHPDMVRLRAPVTPQAPCPA